MKIGQCKPIWCCVRCEVYTAVTMKNAVFWDVTPRGSCKNRTFRRNISPSLSGRIFRSVGLLLVIVHVVPSLPILVNPTMEAICSSETSILTRATRRHIPEDGILHTWYGFFFLISVFNFEALVFILVRYTFERYSHPLLRDARGNQNLRNGWVIRPSLHYYKIQWLGLLPHPHCSPGGLFALRASAQV
jgi:hypothetical protein